MLLECARARARSSGSSSVPESEALFCSKACPFEAPAGRSRLGICLSPQAINGCAPREVNVSKHTHRGKPLSALRITIRSRSKMCFELPRKRRNYPTTCANLLPTRPTPLQPPSRSFLRRQWFSAAVSAKCRIFPRRSSYRSWRSSSHSSLPAAHWICDGQVLAGEVCSTEQPLLCEKMKRDDETRSLLRSQ